MTSRVDVTRIRTTGWREMAPDERLEHLVSAERNERAIVGMRPEVVGVVAVRSVLESRCVGIGIDTISFFLGHHLPQVPQLGCLVFRVAKDVSSIALTVNVGQTFGMAEEDTGFSAITHTSSIPYLERCVIRTRVEDVRRLRVTEADCIDVVLVAGDT
jgi:hypothetical protein